MEKINNIEILDKIKNGTKKYPAVYRCKCHCGKIFESSRLEKVKSCGCSRSKCKIGQRFNKLLILEKTENRKSNGAIEYSCLCDCGTLVKRTSKTLHDRSSCGCHKRVNLIGKRFNKVIVTKFLNKKNKHGALLWEYKCDCGNIGESDLTGLKAKYSCGCTNRFIKGENHPWYNKNLTDDQRVYRNYNNEISFKKQVFKRDNYTCVVCDKTNTKLNAHHLNGYHWCKDGRSDPKNGVCLCEQCHKEFHSKYGNRNNTLFQFIEFMENWHGPSNVQ